MERCGWVSQDPLYIAYHDNEWGVPETDSKKLFEMICLEGQQAGVIVDHRPQKTRKLSRMLSSVRSGESCRNAGRGCRKTGTGRRDYPPSWENSGNYW